MNRYLLTIAILIACLKCAAQSRCDTFHVYFPLNNSALNTDAKSELSSLHAAGSLTARDTLVIMGYADMTGADGHNDSLSEMRARHVKEFLLSHGLAGATYKLCTGRGAVKRSIPTPPGGFPEDRRVDIIAVSDKIHKAETTMGEKSPFDPATFVHAKKGDAFVLDKIYFYRGRHTVKESSNAELENLYHVLAANPKIMISIEGHICCVPNGHDAVDEDFPQLVYTGPDQDFQNMDFDPKYTKYKFRREDSIVVLDHWVREPNSEQLFSNYLSVNRAWKVYQYLVDRGIDPARMSYKGFGSSIHAVPETTAETAKKNMRVEIRIVE